MSVHDSADAGRSAAIRALAQIEVWNMAPDASYTPAIREAADSAMHLLSEAVRMCLRARRELLAEVEAADLAREQREPEQVDGQETLGEMP